MIKTMVMFYLINIVCITITMISADTLITHIIAETVNNYVKDLSGGDIRERVEFHYKLLGLMGPDQRWVHQDLNKLNSNLLPR